VRSENREPRTKNQELRTENRAGMKTVNGESISGFVRLRRAKALAEVGQALRAGSTQVPLAYGKDNRYASPAGASMRSGRALARTNGVTPDDGRRRIASPVDRNSFRSPCGERERDCACPRRFNLYENRYNAQSPLARRLAR